MEKGNALLRPLGGKVKKKKKKKKKNSWPSILSFTENVRVKTKL